MRVSRPGRRWRQRWRWGSLAICLALLWPGAALAGPVEQLVQITLHPTDPGVMALRYENGGGGVLRTADGGKSWRLVCDAALSDASQHTASTLVITGGGTTIRAAFDGLFEDDGHGCAWSQVPDYAGEWIGDLAQHPSDPGIVFAVTAGAASETPKLNGVLRRDAHGAWSALGSRDPLLATRLHVVARGDGLRFYVGAIEGQRASGDGGAPQPNYVTRVSDDDGQSWSEFAFGPCDGTLRIQAVDPTDPDRLLATINRTRESGQATGSGDDSVLVSTDGGASYHEYLKVTEIGAVAFAPDGRVWIGDAGDSSDLAAPKGLWFAQTLAEPAHKLAQADYPVQCLGYQPTTQTLFACQHFWFGRVGEDGTFDSMLKLNEVTEFAACEGRDMAAVCQQQLCGAYCGFGHFARAPLCSTYDVPNYCGASVAKIEDGDSSSTAPSTSVASAAAGQGATDTTAGKSVTDAGVPAPGQLPEPAKPSAKQPAMNCSAGMVASAKLPDPVVAAGALLVLLWLCVRRTAAHARAARATAARDSARAALG